MLGGIWNKSRCPIGLDFGTHSLKMLQLEHGAEGLVAAAAASAPVPADLPPEGPARRQAIAAILRQMLGSGRFRGRRVVSCLPAGLIQYKNLRLPKMPSDELRAAVEWEAGDRLQLKADTALQFFDAGEVRQGEDIRQEVILMAAPSAAVTEHLETLLDAGLQPIAIDAVPGALSRCFESLGSSDLEAPAQVVIDVGYHSTKILIARRGRVLFFKLIEVGGRKLDETVAQHLNLPLADAVELRRELQHKTAETPTGGEQPLFGSTRRDNVERAVYESLRATVGDLAREIGLCLRYYSVTFRGRRPDSALLVGGEAHEPQLAKLLADGAGVAVEPANPLAGVDLENVDALLRGSSTLSEWAVAAGLSMRVPSRAALRGAA